MVHYRQSHASNDIKAEHHSIKYLVNYPTIRFPDNEYWKLEAEDRESARAERGFLDYDQCSFRELSRFCKERHLVPSSEHPADFIKLKKLLQQADERATFNGFPNLPPELRVRIYEYHKCSLDFNHFSTAPPITAVSKLIRREATSAFFKERIFLIHRERTWPPLGDMSLQMVTGLFFDKAPLRFIRSLRRLEIMTPLRDGTGYAEFEIDLTARAREKRAFFVSMGTSWAPWMSHRAEGESMVNGVVEKLRDLVDHLVARKTVAFEIAFERGDADAILRILASTADAE